MNTNSIGFIGGGRVTRILLGGWKCAGRSLDNVLVSDPNPDTLAALKALHPAITVAPGDNRGAAGKAVVFLAVHPPVMTAVLTELRGAIAPSTLLVSLAPKFTLAKLGDLLGSHARLARVIPNAPSILGLGYNPVCFAEGLPAETKTELSDLLAPLGDGPEVAEHKLEAFALLTGMGPTYLWFQLQTLRDLALGFGLTEADVAPALKRMVCGATRTLLESRLSPAEVMDLIPVKPLAEDEPAIKQAYQSRLPALFAKIKP